MDWLKWHNQYDSSATLQSRLRLVRTQTANAILTCPNTEIRIISICAGDGRDVIGTLLDHPYRERVRAYLVEIHPELVRQGESAVLGFGLAERVKYLQADATLSNTYQSISPADVLIISGVFGHVPDTAEMIRNLRCLCRGIAVWTRRISHPGGQGAAEVIDQQFSAAGFRTVTLEHTMPDGVVVGSSMLLGEPSVLTPGIKLFDFNPTD